jgi:hypothetical protein
MGVVDLRPTVDRPRSHSTLSSSTLARRGNCLRPNVQSNPLPSFSSFSNALTGSPWAALLATRSRAILLLHISLRLSFLLTHPLTL